MAGYVTNPWAARLLEATAGKTAITTGTVYLGLALTIPDDPLTATLANITEVTTAGYARIAIPAFSAATTTAPIKITTPTAFSFAAFTADQATEANWAFLADVLSGTAGILRYLFQLEVPVLGRTGEPLNIPASTLILE
jgi:hypothetical protein